MDSKLTLTPDREFIKIINSCKGWEEITKALGYSKKPSSYIINKIKERCLKLGLTLSLMKLDPVDNETKGSLLIKRKNYQSYRSAIRRKAERVFFESGKERKCEICGYDKHIEIAHVKPVSEFSEDTLISEINSIDNLMALCPNHHWEYDNGILKL